MMKLVKRIPVPMAGVMLGLAGLGRLLAPYGQAYSLLCAALATLALILVLARIAFDWPGIRTDLANPIQAGIAGTFSMGLWILVNYLAPLSLALAILVWWLALMIHGGLLAYHAWRFLRLRRLEHWYPSTFIPFVGLLAACTSAPAVGQLALGQGIFWFGALAYFALLPVIIVRLLRVGGLPEPARPTLAIFAAPASLCLVAYLGLFPSPEPILELVWGGLGLLSTLAVLLLLPRLWGEFQPSLAAFGFPLVVSALAMSALAARHGEAPWGPAVLRLSWIETGLAAVVVAVIVARYLAWLLPSRQRVPLGGQP